VWLQVHGVVEEEEEESRQGWDALSVASGDQSLECHQTTASIKAGTVHCCHCADG